MVFVRTCNSSLSFRTLTTRISTEFISKFYLYPWERRGGEKKKGTIERSTRSTRCTRVSISRKKANNLRRQEETRGLPWYNRYNCPLRGKRKVDTLNDRRRNNYSLVTPFLHSLRTLIDNKVTRCTRTTPVSFHVRFPLRFSALLDYYPARSPKRELTLRSL